MRNIWIHLYKVTSSTFEFDQMLLQQRKIQNRHGMYNKKKLLENMRNFAAFY